MVVPAISEACRRRGDILFGGIGDADFTTDLAQVVTSRDSERYVDPKLFVANIWPAASLTNLFDTVRSSPVGSDGAVLVIFHIDTRYGGDKADRLIAAAYAASRVASVLTW